MSKQKIVAIGADIGGTSVKIGLVNSRGKILTRETFLTESALGREPMLDILAGHIFEFLKGARKSGFRVAGVGIGAPGPIDVERGFVYFFPNIPGWKNTPLKAWLQKRVKLPVYVDNDANVMALAEFLYGNGRGTRDMIALTLGTGVGGGLVINGKLFHGPRYSAAEIGHLVINENGPRCSCGSHGCIETYVGSGFFVKEVQKRLRLGGKSVLKRWLREGKELSPYLVSEAAKKGDAFSREIWHETAAHLGTALAGLVNILNPEKIVLGGGVAQNKKFFFRAVEAAIRKKAFPIAAQSVKVMPAALGVDAGLIGAAALAF